MSRHIENRFTELQDSEKPTTSKKALEAKMLATAARVSYVNTKVENITD